MRRQLQRVRVRRAAALLDRSGIALQRWAWVTVIVIGLSAGVSGQLADSDERMMEECRAAFLRETAPDAYAKFVREQDPQKRKFVFAVALKDTQLTLLGAPVVGGSEPRHTASVRKGLLTRLAGMFRSLSPVDLAKLEQAIPKTQPAGHALDPQAAAHAGQRAEVMAKGLLVQYVSPEQATLYGTAPLPMQADLLLQAAMAVLNARPWPTAYVLSMTDFGEGYSGRENIVRRFLGTESPEYREWPTMSARMRGSAVTHAFVTAAATARLLAQGDISVDEFEQQLSLPDLADMTDPKKREAVAHAGGLELLKRYDTGSPSEKDEILKFAILKRFGWTTAIFASL